MNESAARELLRRVARREVPNDAIYSAVHQLGHMQYKQAKGVVELLLTDPDPELRYIALSVLTLHWGCVDQIQTCIRMARSDPDDDVKGMALAGLGSLGRGTHAPALLVVLLEVIENPTPDWLLRAAAHEALLKVLGWSDAEVFAVRRAEDDTSPVWEGVREAREILIRSRAAGPG